MPERPIVHAAPRRRFGRRGVSVVVLVSNDALNLPHVLARLPRGLHEVIVCDEGSRDGSSAVVRALLPGARVLACRPGEAEAVGRAAATGHTVVIVAGDGSVDPCQLAELREPVAA